METAPTIQWGYLINLTVLRLCQYFGAKESASSATSTTTGEAHKQAGRPYTGINFFSKPVRPPDNRPTFAYVSPSCSSQLFLGPTDYRPEAQTTP